jgi:hypothetical protein
MGSAIPLPHPDHGPAELLDAAEEKVMGGRSLVLTLQKLYIWEKKLYDEVKVCASCLLMIDEEFIYGAAFCRNGLSSVNLNS